MLKERLEAEIGKLVENLRQQGKSYLSSDIEKNWSKTVLEYSKELWNFNDETKIENELLNAFVKEWQRIGMEEGDIEKAKNSFLKHRTIQTAPHLGLTESARMLTVNWLSTRGLPPDAYYLVGMFSGIPFSNLTKPGCLNFSNAHRISEIISDSDVVDTEQKISLFPSILQDRIVYGSTIPEKMVGVISNLNPEIKKYFTTPTIGESYTKYALGSVAKIEKEILNIKNAIYFDINEVIRNYLLEVLKNDSHIIYKILFNNEYRSKIENEFGDEAILFYGTYLSSKYESMEKLYIKNGTLHGQHHDIEITPENIIEKIESGSLCPGLFLVYLILTFINHIQCLGSFAQAEYLPRYGGGLLKTGIFDSDSIKNAPVNNLTTGMLADPDLHDITPLDILLGSKWNPDENMYFGELLLGIENLLYKPKK